MVRPLDRCRGWLPAGGGREGRGGEASPARSGGGREGEANPERSRSGRGGAGSEERFPAPPPHGTPPLPNKSALLSRLENDERSFSNNA